MSKKSKVVTASSQSHCIVGYSISQCYYCWLLKNIFFFIQKSWNEIKYMKNVEKMANVLTKMLLRKLTEIL